MPNGFKRAMPGEPLNIPAATYNAMLDAAEAHKNRQVSTQSPPQAPAVRGDLIRVKYTGEEPTWSQEAYTPVVLQAPLLPANPNPASQVMFGVDSLVQDSQRGKVAILQASLRDGELGWACITGVCYAKVYLIDAAHQWAEIVKTIPMYPFTDGQETLMPLECLYSCDQPASARILWHDGSIGTSGGSVAVVEFQPRQWLPKNRHGRVVLQTGNYVTLKPQEYSYRGSLYNWVWTDSLDEPEIAANVTSPITGPMGAGTGVTCNAYLPMGSIVAYVQITPDAVCPGNPSHPVQHMVLNPNPSMPPEIQGQHSPGMVLGLSATKIPEWRWTEGLSATIPIPKLTEGGADGSMTFTNGLLTARTNPM